MNKPGINQTEISDQLEVSVNWESINELLPGRSYLFNFQDKVVKCTFTKLKNRFNKSSNHKIAANTLSKGDSGLANISLKDPIHFVPRGSEGFPTIFQILDPIGKTIVGTGAVNHGLRRASNITWQNLDINKSSRAAIKNQQPCVIWFTGFSGSGKSTIANLVEKKLFELSKHSYLLDGDNVRHGLNKDLGFTDADRVENIRRIAETAKLMADAGLIVLTSFISPFRSERLMARQLMEDSEFVEVFVDTPLALCEQRDPKGLYKKVRDGQIKNFTGFDSPYEPPEKAEITIKTAQVNAEDAATQIVNFIINKK